jgi:hypothetical protein
MSIPTEATWTAPSAWCPHPHQWHADDTEATEHEVSELAGAFTRALQPEIVVETGTYRAQTSRAIAGALAANGHGHLWTIEIDADLASEAERELAELPATVICADSQNWEPPAGIGFAWIDSGPLNVQGAWLQPGPGTTRYDEISRWLRLFEPGAVIGIHDTAPHHPVLAALLPLFASAALLPGVTLRTPRGVTFAQVPGSPR